MAIETQNLFDAIPHKIDKELFTNLAYGENVKIERIVSKGHSSPESGWYDQDAHEWVIVLQGEAKIAFENNDTAHLAAGDYLNIPAHTKHKVTWTLPDSETIWLAIHYS